MIGRQLPFMALLLPFYVMALYGGSRSVKALWPVLLVAGGSFAAGQFVSSNFLDYALTDVLSSLDLADRDAAVPASLEAGRRSRLSPSAEVTGAARQTAVPAWQGWLPWIVVSVVVIVWTHFKIIAIGQQDPLAGPAQPDLDHPLQ